MTTQEIWNRIYATRDLARARTLAECHTNAVVKVGMKLPPMSVGVLGETIALDHGRTESPRDAYARLFLAQAVVLA